MNFKERTNYVLYTTCKFLLEILQLFVYYCADSFRPQVKKLWKFFFQSCGIELNGEQEYDIKVNDEKAFAIISAYGATGFFECFVEKYLETKDVEKMFEKIVKGEYFWIIPKLDYSTRIIGWLNKTFDVQTIENSWKDGGDHYDEFSEAIKDISGPLVLHSCLNFDETDKMEEAETNQLKLFASKLKLKPGMKILDIGCGFGTLAEYLAKNFDVSVTGVTISEEMAQMARERCAKLNVNIIVCDYRQIPVSKYDRITCIEMMEHIGEQHHSKFFDIVHERLKDDGIFLLQIVSNNQPYMFEYNPVFEKFLKMRITFPRIQKTIQKACDYFVLEQLHNQGYNYGISSSGLYKNLVKFGPVMKQKYGDRFYRIFCFYLAFGSAYFRSREMHNFLIVFSKNGLNYSYSKV